MDKGIDEHIVGFDVVLDVLIGPCGQRVYLHQPERPVETDQRGVGPRRRFDPTDTRHPRHIATQRLAQRLDLAHPAALVGFAGEQVLAEQFVLFGDRVLGGHVDDVDVVDRLDGVAGADGLHEAIAGVQEQHVDTGADLRGQIDQHRVLHVGRHHVVAAEVRVGPGQQVVRIGASQIGGTAFGQLA